MRWDRWLHAEADDAMTLVRQYPAGQLIVDHTSERWSANRKVRPPAEPTML